jgi:hypothetical protein
MGMQRLEQIFQTAEQAQNYPLPPESIAEGKGEVAHV